MEGLYIVSGSNMLLLIAIKCFLNKKSIRSEWGGVLLTVNGRRSTDNGVELPVCLLLAIGCLKSWSSFWLSLFLQLLPRRRFDKTFPLTADRWPMTNRPIIWGKKRCKFQIQSLEIKTAKGAKIAKICFANLFFSSFFVLFAVVISLEKNAI